MCRLAAYLGPEVTRARFLLEPAHGLVEQYYAPREMQEARLNADGYGFGWFAADEAPAVFTSQMPIWSDTNLESLGRALAARQWLANVRSATRRMPVAQLNTMPFADAEFLFLHNGYVDRFGETLRPRVRQALAPQFETTIQGNTDSEYLFAYLRQILDGDDDMPVEEGLAQLFDTLADWLGDTKALLNVIVGDGERLYCARHAINGECPSLYFTTDDEDFPGGQIVASEPLTGTEFWQPVPEHAMLILDLEQPPQLLQL